MFGKSIYNQVRFQMRPKILYVYDALCGWCYGFSPVMQALFVAYQGRVDFDVLSGGMILGDRVGTINEKAPFIKTAYRQVEEVTGVLFGEAFLKDMMGGGDMQLNSLKPGLALTTLKALEASKIVPFTHALQRAVYFDGRHPDKWEMYVPLAETMGLMGDEFVNQMQEETVLQQTQAEFETVKKMGIYGFPTVVWIDGPNGYVLARGYTPLNSLKKSVEQLLLECT